MGASRRRDLAASVAAHQRSCEIERRRGDPPRGDRAPRADGSRGRTGARLVRFLPRRHGSSAVSSGYRDLQPPDESWRKHRSGDAELRPSLCRTRAGGADLRSHLRARLPESRRDGSVHRRSTSARSGCQGSPRDRERSVDVEHIPVRLAWRGWRSARRLPGALLRWLFVAPVRFLRLRRHFDREFREKVQPAEAARLREQDLSELEVRSFWLRFVPGSSVSSISATTTRSPTAFHSSATSCCGGSSSACTSNRRMSSRRGSPPDCPATSTPRRISISPVSRRARSEWRSFWTGTGTAAARTTRSRPLGGGRIRGGSRRWRRRSRGPSRSRAAVRGAAEDPRRGRGAALRGDREALLAASLAPRDPERTRLLSALLAPARIHTGTRLSLHRAGTPRSHGSCAQSRGGGADLLLHAGRNREADRRRGRSGSRGARSQQARAPADSEGNLSAPPASIGSPGGDRAGSGAGSGRARVFRPVGLDGGRARTRACRTRSRSSPAARGG